MSDNAEIVRNFIVTDGFVTESEEAIAALDALVAEQAEAYDALYAMRGRAEAAEDDAKRLRKDLGWIAERCGELIGLYGTNEYVASSIETRARKGVAR